MSNPSPGIAFYAASGAAVTDAEGVEYCKAQSAQFAEDVCPAWARAPIAASWFSDAAAIPPDMPCVQLRPHCDVPQALAYHTENAQGRIVGVVGLLECAADGTPWTAAASHEAIEGSHNPFVNGWTEVPANAPMLKAAELGEIDRFAWKIGRDLEEQLRGALFRVRGTRQVLVANELCDPVQAGTYQKAGVELSSFVTPEWFDGIAGKGPFDFLGVLAAAFSVDAGGYAEIDAGGVISQVGQAKAHRSRVKPIHWRAFFESLAPSHAP